ncbi:MAG: hypothetical protein QOE90_2202 [Thermoplasmata archaeon]|nr:hypothetical protein [Thermoplasmata archaeon]
MTKLASSLLVALVLPLLVVATPAHAAQAPFFMVVPCNASGGVSIGVPGGTYVVTVTGACNFITATNVYHLPTPAGQVPDPGATCAVSVGAASEFCTTPKARVLGCGDQSVAVNGICVNGATTLALGGTVTGRFVDDYYADNTGDFVVTLTRVP